MNKMTDTDRLPLQAFGEIHLDRCWKKDLKEICFVVGGQQSASTAVTKQLNRGRSDPVYTDSAKKPDLAKGCPEKMLFLQFCLFCGTKHAETSWKVRQC